MTILNQTELSLKNESLFQSDVEANISAADIREFHYDIIDSLQAYPGVISDAVVENLSVTATPTKLNTFSRNDTSENEIFNPDFVNGAVEVKVGCLCFLTFRFNGKWNTGEDLTFEAYMNGAPNPITPFIYSKEGKGSSDPELISVSSQAFIVPSSAIIGGKAVIEMYISSSTGAFLLDQDSVTLGLQYDPLSIRAV